MTDNKAVPDFLASDVADMEANPVTRETPAPTPEPEADQVAEAPEAEQAPPAPDIEAIDGEDRGQFVRKAALYEERQRRKEAVERSKEWERRYTDSMQKAQERLEALFRQAQQGNAPQQPQAPQIPSLDEDPIGHFKAKNEELERQVREQAEWRKSQAEREKQQTDIQRISSEVSRLESEFAKVTPDYYQAHEFLQNAWVNEARALGLPDHEIAEAVRSRSIETIQIASRLGKNPAEVAYSRANALGYKKTAPAAQTPQAKTPDLDRIAKGVATAKSPSAAAGAPSGGLNTIESLLSMPEEEFAAKFGTSDNKAWDREMKRLMGIH